MSLNVISLSGLILAVGMMIDSAIIVTENISQYRERGYSLKRSCAVGTTEMITPMLSSSLTTIAVFVPLIFMSGIAGAIFMDQAFSITVGLMISYITGIMLLPVLYLLFYKVGIRSKGFLSRRFDNLLKNDFYSLTLDMYPISKLRLYADFSQSVFEIVRNHYSINSFLNAGMRYDFNSRWSASANINNLFNRKDYDVSLYQKANFQYYRVPLRGREFMISLRLKY